MVIHFRALFFFTLSVDLIVFGLLVVISPRVMFSISVVSLVFEA